jgi:hypothetical protein
VRGPFNPGGPTDVAVIHHYLVKSREEYEWKMQRGRADAPLKRDPSFFDAINATANEVEDASARDFFIHGGG